MKSTMKALCTVAASAVVVLALAGCTASPHRTGTIINSTPGSYATLTPSPTASATQAPSETPSATPSGGDNSAGQAPDAPSLTVAAKQQLVDSATATMTAYARPGISAQQWYSDLAPHLTAEAAPLFKGIDPSIIPAHKVGAVTVDPVSTGAGAVVYVTTDAGRYRLFMLCASPGSPWLAQQINAPS